MLENASMLFAETHNNVICMRNANFMNIIVLCSEYSFDQFYHKVKLTACICLPLISKMI